VELGRAGGIRVAGSTVESVGSEPVVLVAASSDGALASLSLEPGRSVQMAPFPPLPRWPLATLEPAMSAVCQPTLVHPEAATPGPPAEATSVAEAGRFCPMCHKLHHDARLELAA
jgi:hypothetical protein